MIWLYIASAIFGGAFVIPMLMGAVDFDADVGEIDVGDVDLDMGADVDVGDLDVGDVDTGGGFSGVIGDIVGSLLNFRSIVMGALFFGLAGIVFTILDTNAALTFITAAILALIAAAINGGVTRYVLGQQQSSHVTMGEMAGAEAEVLLPIAGDRKGRIRAVIAGQTEYFVALPFKDGQSFEAGEMVVVIEIEQGMAKVASLRELGS